MDAKALTSLGLIMSLCGCAGLGSVMSPYPEHFSCKNDDHGQCVHPDRAYADAVAGVASRSDPEVTRKGAHGRRAGMATGTDANAYGPYRESVYRELQGLIEEPVTPMLRQPRTVRTLILPYATSDRPDRLYMSRYVYSVMDRPIWTIGQYLVRGESERAQMPVLGQVQNRAMGASDTLEGAAPDVIADKATRP